MKAWRRDRVNANPASFERFIIPDSQMQRTVLIFALAAVPVGSRAPELTVPAYTAYLIPNADGAEVSAPPTPAEVNARGPS